MGQTFQYPNLVAGTRADGGMATAPHGSTPIPRVALAAAPGGYAYVLSNATKGENFAITRETFRLRHGVGYALSLWAAATGNVGGMDCYVLASGTHENGWVAAYKGGISPASGGGVRLPGVLPARGEQRGLGVLRAIRQQREHGRQGVDALGRGRHALRGRGGPRLGTCGGGGVALSER